MELVLRPQVEQAWNPKVYLERTNVYATSIAAWPNIPSHLVFPIQAFPSHSTFPQAVTFSYPPADRQAGRYLQGERKAKR